jgi:hypothetical protein
VNFPVQHLSDEAVAAFADGVLTGLPRGRASRHVAECAECRRAVEIQREAAWVLRAAPAPSLPSGLADRLRAVPQRTPVSVPVTFGPDGMPLFRAHAASMDVSTTQSSATAPAAPMAAVVRPAHPRSSSSRLGRHLPQRLGVLTAAAAAVAISAVAASSGGRPAAPGSGTFAPARISPSGPAIMGGVDPALLMRTVSDR